MGYNIELSVNLMKLKKFTDLEHLTRYFKEYFKCESVYTLTETDGTAKIPRYSYVIIVAFIKDKFEQFLNFIDMVKTQKNLYIECIYHEDSSVQLLYASSYYLKTIDKEFVVKYRKPRSYSDEEIKVLNKVK
jgi:hypothetical protein